MSSSSQTPVAVTSVANSASLPPVEVETDGHRWAEALIDALEDIQHSLSRVPEIKEGESPDPVEQLAGLKRVQMDFSLAQSRLAPFKTSRVKLIAASAGPITVVLEGLLANEGERYRLSLALYSNRGMDSAEMLDRSAAIRATADRLGEELARSGGSASYGFFRVPEDEKAHFEKFDFTRAQCEKLKQRLRSIWGDDVTEIKAGQSNVALAAAGVYSVLANKHWRASDE